MPEGYHPPLEEYLESIHELEEDGIVVIQARLAERLGHSAPTVSETVRRLRDSGHIEIRDRIIKLTAKGEHAAQGVVRKHRLAERLLVDVIGMAWHESHMEATRWEHVISDEVERRLNAMLGEPATCPHGNPIPGAKQSNAKVRQLSSVDIGETVTLRRVTEQVEFDTPSLTYLGENNFIPGVRGLVKSRDNAGNMVVVVNDKELSINKWLSQLLYVAA